MRRRLFAAALLIPAALLGATPAVADTAHRTVVSATAGEAPSRTAGISRAAANKRRRIGQLLGSGPLCRY